MSNTREVNLTLYHPVYNFIYRNEYLLPIASTAGVGFLNFGLQGLALGAVGAGDVIAKQLGYRLYLTEAVLSYSLCNSFGNYVIKYLGAALGASISIGIIKIRDLGKLATPVSGYIYGYSLGKIVPAFIGMPSEEVVQSILPEFEAVIFQNLRAKLPVMSAAIGGGLGVIDEFLSYKNYTHSYLFTNSIKTFVLYRRIVPGVVSLTKGLVPQSCSAFINFFGNSALLSSAAILHIILNFKDKKPYVHPSIILVEDVYKVYSSIIAPNQLNELITSQYIISITSSLFSTRMALIFDDIAQKASLSLFGLNNQDYAKYEDFINKAFMMLAFSLPYIVNKATDEMLNSYPKKKLEYIVSDILNEKITSKGVLSALKQNRTENIINKDIAYIQTEALEEYLPSDIEKIVDVSSLISFVSQVSAGIYSMGHLYKNDALDTLAFSSLYNFLANKASAALAKELESIYPKIKEVESDIRLKADYARLNYNSMDISDANEFVNSQRREKLNEMEQYKADALSWRTAWSFWFGVEKVFELISSWLIIGNQMHLGNVKQDMAKQEMTMLQAFSTMISWESETAAQVSILKESLIRIEELNARMNEAGDVAKVTPQYIYKQSAQPSIFLKNVSVGVEEEAGLHIDELYLNKKIIAVTSASGGGKSTFFKALAQMNKSNVWSSGEITYYTKNGHNLTSFMFSQSAFITPQSTLLEIITYKSRAEAQNLREKTADLLMQIRIDPSKDNKEDILSWLDSKKDWFTYLSGGQKQKIGIVRLLLKEDLPDLILLDEVFAGLDHNSIKTAQHMLKTKFNDSMILIIDHEAMAHNSNNFYDGLLHLENGTAILTDFIYQM